MNKSRGFTIIELIVVIAIIAVLAAIVLVNVTQYIGKGKNAAIKGNLATLLTNGAVFYDSQTPGSFTGFGADTALGCAGQIDTAISDGGGGLACQVAADGTAWCGCSALNSVSGDDAFYCVDSSGVKKGYDATSDCDTYCPDTGICS